MLILVVETMEKIDIPTLQEEQEMFSARIKGQDAAVKDFAFLLADLRSQIKLEGKGPRASLFLAGPSGVGKTEMTLTLADLLAQTEGDEKGSTKIIVINGGEFQEDHSISRLIGSPPGYVGSSGDRDNYIRPLLSTENLDANLIKYKKTDGTEASVNIILIDEAEKAHDNFHRLFLSILDKGTIQMADNSLVDMTNSVIIFTSNLGNVEIEKSMKSRFGLVKVFDNSTKKKMVEDAVGDRFPPEIRGRINQFIIFEHLTPDVVKEIAMKMLNEMLTRFHSSGINLDLIVSKETLDWLSEHGHNTSEGARFMKKYINSNVYNQLMLINTDTNLNGKRVAILLNEKKEGLDFYWAGQEQLDPSKDTLEWAIVSELNKRITMGPKRETLPALFDKDNTGTIFIDRNKFLGNINIPFIDEVDRIITDINKQARKQNIQTIDAFSILVLDPIINDRLRVDSPHHFNSNIKRVEAARKILWPQ